MIKPLDFTQEWIKQKKRLHSRHSRHDEDDEIDIEMESIARKLRKKFNSDSDKKSKNSEANETKKIGEQLDFVSDIDSDTLEQFNDLAPLTQPSDRENKPVPKDELNALDDPNDIGAEAIETAEQTPERSIDPNVPIQQDQIIQEPLMTRDRDFPPQNSAPPIPQEQPNQNQSIDPKVEIDKENIYQKARSDGFEDGYRYGEEKAMLVVEEKVSMILSELANVVKEFEGLKGNILASTQENFQTVCQSLLESLLQKEFEMNPDSFTKVIQKAIAEAVPDDEFKILVSQDSYERLKSHIPEDLLQKIKVDQELDDHNFKIESQLSVVDGNIRQMITDLLEQADLALFQDEDDKVG
ncbi:MAG: hypothetical protein HRU19_00475 [Pseudobacteriovorax sp.]|nr:hypothetical protein [Pseudobacteriovorax sp.]